MQEVHIGRIQEHAESALVYFNIGQTSGWLVAGCSGILYLLFEGL